MREFYPPKRMPVDPSLIIILLFAALVPAAARGLFSAGNFLLFQRGWTTITPVR